METNMDMTKIAALFAELHDVRPSMLCVEGKSAQELYDIGSKVRGLGRKLIKIAKTNGAKAGKDDDEPQRPQIADAEGQAAPGNWFEKTHGVEAAEGETEQSDALSDEPNWEAMPTKSLVEWFNENAPFADLAQVKKFATREDGIKRCSKLFKKYEEMNAAK